MVKGVCISDDGYDVGKARNLADSNLQGGKKTSARDANLAKAHISDGFTSIRPQAGAETAEVDSVKETHQYLKKGKPK